MTTSQRFILLTPVLPLPADQGSKQFLLSMGETLLQLGSVHWLTREIGDQSASAAELRARGYELYLDPRFRNRGLLSRLSRRLTVDGRALLGRQSRELVYCNPSGLLRETARQAAREESIVVAAFWSMSPALEFAGQSPRVLVLSDVEHVRDSERERLQKNPRSSASRRRKAEETLAMSRADLVLCLTAEDEASARVTVASLEKPPRIGRWPVVIDVVETPDPPRVLESSDRLRVLVHGHWEADFNADGIKSFARELWGQLPEECRSAVHLRVIGKGLDRGVRDELRAAGAEVLGWVDDLGAQLDWADAVSVHLRFAGGIRYRLLESMGRGVPCLSSSIAARGLGLRDSQAILIADEPESLAEGLDQLRKVDVRNRLMENGLRYVRDHFGSDTLRERALHALAPVLKHQLGES